jgi:hypothetical protein
MSDLKRYIAERKKTDKVFAEGYDEGYTHLHAKHVNATDVLPPELVKEIQKYYSGGYLRIPKRGRKNKPRKQAKEDSQK